MTDEKLVPFNMQRALAGEPAYTHDGHEVTDFHYFECYATDYCIAGILNGRILIVKKTGHYQVYGLLQDEQLYMKPKIKTHYANVYKKENGDYYLIWSCLSEEHTKMAASGNPNYVKTISFTLEE